MQHPALKAISVLVSLGVVGLLVAQAGVAGCRSAAHDRPPTTSNTANAANATSPKPGAPSGADASPGVEGNANAVNAATPPSATANEPDPTYLPATKAGPVFRAPPQASAGAK